MNSTPRPETANGIELPTHWTPEQALAVFEAVDLLRDYLWAAYGPEIQRALRDDRVTQQRSLPLDSDEPF
ncbi:hypothetical protein [Azohydromonas lata]|uniref:Uncharacterized protein n=1 Tax=Azohydromonas lata TaxID=45677 RepID=A0ABU5I802_9BURK|nr:hypothetical protein [Azohydromonas lata]MDZ5455219.1 hypothetical protein [Azohydromonas lata]